MKSTQRHCENCGSTDREDLDYGDQGYTACCNELVCYGDSLDTWGNDDVKVRACCGHFADEQLRKHNIDSYWRH